MFVCINNNIFINTDKLVSVCFEKDPNETSDFREIIIKSTNDAWVFSRIPKEKCESLKSQLMYHVNNGTRLLKISI